MPTAIPLDAAMFEALHEAIDSQKESERRGGERHSFACEQLVAPFDGVELPGQAAFQLVRCRDLSLQGISFITHQRPTHKFVVVALGKAPFKFLVARVMHISTAHSPQGTEYTVGCRFERRLM